jgi:C-terminal processing protease CtpA/Prc
MRQPLIIALALLLLGLPCAAQMADQNDTANALPTFTPAQLREDFQVARRALEEGHSGIYRYTPKPELDRVFEAAARSLDHPMNAYEFLRVLAPTVAAIKCGHTGLSLPEPLRKAVNTSVPLLPLSVKVINKRAYVFRDLSTPERRLAGREIRAINNQPATKIIARMLAAASGDGDVETSRQARISGFRFGVLLYTMVGTQSPYELTLYDAKTKREEKVRLDGLTLAKLAETAKASYPQDDEPTRAAELHYLDDGRIAVMKINGFGGFVDAERKKNLKVFYQESFDEMQQKGTRALVLDLRDNGGGADELGKLLLSYLIDQPFKYYDDLVINNDHFEMMKYAGRPDFKISDKQAERGADGKFHATSHPNWGINQPSKPTFTGKVFILINGGSFSTTSEFLSQAHYHKRAVFIGEESGGGYYGNSSGMTPLVTLPNTKLGLRVPLVTYYMAVSGYKAASHGVVPDYPVNHTVDDLIAARDKDMDLALQLARKAMR